MSTKKSRDLAQELVDFLLKEEKQNKGTTPVAPASGKKDNFAKPQLVSPFAVKPAPARPAPAAAEKNFAAIIESAQENPDKTLQLNNEQPTFEQPTFISSIDVRLPDTQKRDPRLPDPDKTEVQRPVGKNEAKADKKEPGDGFTAIEFNIVDQEEQSDVDHNFGATSDKAREILFEVTQAPVAAGSAKPAMKSDSNVFGESSSKPAFTHDAKATVPLAPEPKETTQLTKSQAFSSQRSRIVVNEVTQLMAGAEAVKVAQARISSLERERDELRSETEELLSTTETLQRRFNELKAQHDALERKHKERIEILEDEKAVIRTRLHAKEEDLDRIKKENEDLQLRFKNDLRKIRVRERELEHRQEIMKAEHATVVHSKDEMIIELKRTLERLHFELDNFRAKSADMNTKINEFYERNHRTVKALRLALSVLETGDNEEKSKKASG